MRIFQLIFKLYIFIKKLSTYKIKKKINIYKYNKFLKHVFLILNVKIHVTAYILLKSSIIKTYKNLKTHFKCIFTSILVNSTSVLLLVLLKSSEHFRPPLTQSSSMSSLVKTA